MPNPRSTANGLAATLPSVQPESLSPGQVGRQFKNLLTNGWTIVCDGTDKLEPSRLLRRGYTPKSKVTLFGTDFFLTRPRQNPDLRFFVVYVAPVPPGKNKRQLYARIFYKDISLIWRTASHLFATRDELWIGKGDTKVVKEGEWELEVSAESTTDLPFELQSAVETLNRVPSVKTDVAALARVLRAAPRHRVGAYNDFVRPRRAAASRRGGRINRGRRVAYFRRRNEPSSFTVVDGYEPDFENGVVEMWRHGSKLYGGEIKRFRVVSRNRKIQHLLFRAPNHVWMIPPQALTSELSSYGVRTVDVEVDEDAYIPGYEYHFMDDSDGEPVLHSQIPDGFAGDLSPLDDSRADASRWLNEIPLLRQFRQFADRADC